MGTPFSRTYSVGAGLPISAGKVRSGAFAGSLQGDSASVSSSLASNASAMAGTLIGGDAAVSGLFTSEAWLPNIGQRSNINAGSASEVDYDTHSGIAEPSRWWPGTSNQNAFASMAFAYSATVWAPNYSAKGAVIVNGGGHSSQQGDFAYAFDFSTRQWACIGAPGNVPANGLWFGDSNPRLDLQNSALDLRSLDWLDYDYGGSYIKLSNHEYFQVAYIPPSLGGGEKGDIYKPQTVYSQVNGRADPRVGGSGLAYFWAPHLMDLSTGVQRRATPSPLGAWSGYSGSSSVLDTNRGKLWIFRNGTASCSYHDITAGVPYPTADHTMQRAAGGAATWGLVANCTMVFVPEADAIVVLWPSNQNSAPPAIPGAMLGVEVYAMDTGVPIDQERRSAGSPVQHAMPYGGLFIGAAWVPASVVGGVGKFYLYEGFGDTFAYTLTPSSLNFKTCSWGWGREDFSNAHTGADPLVAAAYSAGNAQALSPLGKWCYVPALECISWHQGPTTSAQCYDGVPRDGIVQLWRPPGAPI